MNFESVAEEDFVSVLRHVGDPIPQRVLLTLNYGHPPFVTREPRALPA